MNVYPVDSSERMLPPQDIFIVAAYKAKEALEVLKKQAKKMDMSPERLLYTILVKEYSDPRLIRIRAGNTLFTIAAMPDEVGIVRVYNADVQKTYPNNLIEFCQSAKRMGFKALVFYVGEAHSEVVNKIIEDSEEKDFVPSYKNGSRIVAVSLNGPFNKEVKREA